MIFEAYKSLASKNIATDKSEYGQPSEEHGGKEGLSRIKLEDDRVIKSDAGNNINFKSGTILNGYYMHRAVEGFGWLIVDPELGEVFITKNNKTKLIHSHKSRDN